MLIYLPAILIGLVTGIVVQEYNRPGSFRSVMITMLGGFLGMVSTPQEAWVLRTALVGILSYLIGLFILDWLRSTMSRPRVGCPICGQPFPGQAPQVHICR